LLKWAGGKRQLLPFFRRFYPAGFTRYFEPFLGSAAVFFDLYSDGRLRARPVFLTDSNRDLIGCYGAVRDESDRVLAVLRHLAAGHQREGTTHYYRVRDQFNRRRLAVGDDDGGSNGASLAAMLIYLNRTGYNGLFRLNAKGRFNVPAGRYANPRICDAPLVRAVSTALAAPVLLSVKSYDDAVGDARAGDFLYFDPPYVPLSPTSTFGAYTAVRFSPDDQERLCDLVVSLARRQCAVMLSNSSAASIGRLYRRAASASGAGLSLWEVPARRAINSRAQQRGAVTELLLTNLEPRDEPPQSFGPSDMADSDSRVRGR
jgi:DNA adenine methylase